MQKSLFKNIIYKVLLNLFNLILPILVGPYVYRTLGASSIGNVQFSESIFNYFFIFAVFGVYQYGMREMSLIKHDKEKVSKLFTSLFTVTFITSILSLIVYLIFSYIGYRESIIFPILLIYGINFIGSIFYVEWVNEAYENYDFITIKTIIVRIFYVIFLFVLIKGSEDYHSYAWLLVLSTFLNNIISFIYVKRRVSFNFQDIGISKHLKPLFLVVIFSNANILYTQLDRYMLGQYVDTKSVSYYAMAQQIMSIIHMLMLSIIQVTIPRLSHLSGNEDNASYINLLNTISKIYLCFLFPASIGLYIVSDVGVYIYGGAEFINTSTVLSIFSLYMISLGFESIVANQVIYVKKGEKMLVKLIFICGGLNLFLNITLVKLNILSPSSAILTTTLSNFLLFTLEYIYIRKGLKINFRLFELSKIKYGFYSLLFIPTSYFIRLFIADPIPLFITLIITNSLLYTLILILTKDEILMLFINKIKTRFNN
ncbi:oligosaccharide flippase family protein [Bacillus pacificus]|uniref:oligosaccharide flippase family protein n=1 Tax=Bacillus pacificus TaxID=2026187 RepID=UPI001E3EF27D|nr:oligosaccharide flippase family protein [Bacillus pacificus]MCC2387537.1 oligosaccharide flippase family protein [Bacillus pacificus]UEP94926.1 oligosaccharide flippase family protein [Bacillus pacificus]